MGVLCCKLFQLFCCPPCLSNIVNKLAFSPPTCTYSIVKDEEGKEKITINGDGCVLISSNEKYIEYHGISLDSGRVIACVYLRTARYTKNTILLSHGNAVDIGMILAALIDLGLKLKVNVVTYDYSGYGISSGKPSETSMYSDIVTVFEFVRQRLNIPAQNVIVYGQSIGSVPSTFLATKYNVGLLVLHSPLASGCHLIPGCGCAHGCCDVLDNSSRAGDIKSPTLVMHGIEDNVVPVEHSYHIVDSLPDDLVLDPLYILSANHNDCEIYPEYMDRLTDVLRHELPRFQERFTDSLYCAN